MAALLRGLFYVALSEPLISFVFLSLISPSGPAHVRDREFPIFSYPLYPLNPHLPTLESILRIWSNRVCPHMVTLQSP
jgi:hypothetical protein